MFFVGKIVINNCFIHRLKICLGSHSERGDCFILSVISMIHFVINACFTILRVIAYADVKLF